MIVALVEGEFGQDPATTAEVRFGIARYVGEMLLDEKLDIERLRHAARAVPGGFLLFRLVDF